MVRTATVINTRTRRTDAALGTRLGPYELVERLGHGGSCTVYRATHIDLGVQFAIKVLHHGRSCEEAYVARLRREAAAGIRIDHPRIVRVLELGVAHGDPYLVMELVRGRTLYEVLRVENRLTPARAANIARQIAEGLSAAHRAGYVHRDLKPSNVMLAPMESGDEEVKILDLGIVRVHGECAEPELTGDDLILGTPMYMAPEQFHSSQVGPSADLYALGVLLFHMLAGRPPFVGTFQEIIAQHMVAAHAPLPATGGLEEVVRVLLAKTPEERPATADAVMEMIDARREELEAELAFPATRLEPVPSAQACSVSTVAMSPDGLELE